MVLTINNRQEIRNEYLWYRSLYGIFMKVRHFFPLSFILIFKPCRQRYAYQHVFLNAATKKSYRKTIELNLNPRCAYTNNSIKKSIIFDDFWKISSFHWFRIDSWIVRNKLQSLCKGKYVQLYMQLKNKLFSRWNLPFDATFWKLFCKICTNISLKCHHQSQIQINMPPWIY